MEWYAKIPTKFYFTGDKQTAFSYKGFATQKLGELQRFMSFRNLSTASKNFDLPDGTKINIISNFGRTYITIHSQPKVSERRVAIRTGEVVRVSYRYENARDENVDKENPNTVTIRINGIDYEHVPCFALLTDIDSESYDIAGQARPALTPETSNSCRVFFATGNTFISRWDNTAKKFEDSFSKSIDSSGIQWPIVEVEAIEDEDGAIIDITNVKGIIKQPFVDAGGDSYDITTTFWPMIFVKTLEYEIDDSGNRINPTNPRGERFGLFDIMNDKVAEITTSDHSAKKMITWKVSDIADFEWLISSAIRVETDDYMVDLSEDPDPDQLIADMYQDMLDQERDCMAIGEYDVQPVQCAQPALNTCVPWGGPPPCPYDSTVAAWEDHTSGSPGINYCYWVGLCCLPAGPPGSYSAERNVIPTAMYELIMNSATGPFLFHEFAGTSEITPTPDTATKKRKLWANGHFEAGYYNFGGAAYRVDQANGSASTYRFYLDPNHPVANCNLYVQSNYGPVAAYAKLHIGETIYGSDLYLTDTNGYAVLYFNPPCPQAGGSGSSCSFDIGLSGSISLSVSNSELNKISCDNCFEYIGIFSMLFDTTTTSLKKTSDSSAPGYDPGGPPNVVDEDEVVTDKHTANGEIIIDVYNDVVERDKVCFNNAYNISGACTNFLDNHLYPTNEPIHNWNAVLHDKPIDRNGYEGHLDYRAPFDDKEEVVIDQVALVYVPYDKYLRAAP